MPLPLPIIDRRTWDDLVAEARALLPEYAAGWTDLNPSDPGSTLVELFAWLTELLTFRADRIPDAQLRAYLRWLGIHPRPARPATAVLALSLRPARPAAAVPGGLTVADPTTRLAFQADEPVVVSPAWLELDPAEGTRRGALWSAFGGSVVERTADNCRTGHEFLALGPAPVPGDALLLGFDCLPGAPGDVLNLYAWTAAWRTDGAVRDRLIGQRPDCPQETAGGWDTRAECVAGVPAPGPARVPDWHLHYSARTVWEAWTGAGWEPLDVVADETRALSLTGPVRLRLGALQADPPHAPVPGRWWIRCRLRSGSYECPPRLAGIAVNTVVAAHSVLVPGVEVLGSSRGHARESYRLSGAIAALGPDAPVQPVLAGTLRLRLTAGGSPDDSWAEVPDWDRTGPADKHFTLDSATNTVSFGDGWIGRVPPAGATVAALDYRVGGGPDANLPAHRLTRILTGAGGVGIVNGVVAHQPFDAIGGTAAQSLDAAHGQALDQLRTPARGVTVADWEALALDVPGVPVARAVAIPGHHPALDGWDAAGVVTLVVVPACGAPPRPGADFLNAVNRRLQQHRPLTTELHVVGPRYVPITVTASLHTRQPVPGLAAAAQATLDRFFDPLTGGPEGTGWPFGRGVLASDVLAVLAAVPGVRYVDGLGLRAGEAEVTCDNLDLCGTELVESLTHLFTVVEDAR